MSDQKCFFLWLGEDGDAEEVTEEEFMKRMDAAKAAWDAWCELKDLEAHGKQVN